MQRSGITDLLHRFKELGNASEKREEGRFTYQGGNKLIEKHEAEEIGRTKSGSKMRNGDFHSNATDDRCLEINDR